ncbi:MAG: hypothetical protein ABWZ88_10505 [Variovorax sp.]
MFIQSFLVIPSLSLLFATLLSACSPSAQQQRPDIARDPASYRHVMAILSEAEKTPAAGDDFTLYIGRDFAESERQALLAHVASSGGRTD